MTGSRTALLIATNTYTDATFGRLRAPTHDVAALADVLGDPEIGGYRVSVLDNRPSHEVRIAINELFATAGRNDLVLLYASGHGIKDEAGRLHVAATDTQRALLVSTAVPASFIRDLIDSSLARKVVVWLDCCYGGAFPAGMVPKAGATVDVLPQLAAEAGRGCAVMTASTHIQFAFEGGQRLKGQAQPSVFTSAIVEGLRTGDADRDGDGEIDAVELYGYVYDRVKAITPHQTPTRNDQVTGELSIARSKRGLWLPADLPKEIRMNLGSSRPGFRLSAVQELAELVKSEDEHQRSIAIDTLRQLTKNEDRELAEAAELALPRRPEPTPEQKMADKPKPLVADRHRPRGRRARPRPVVTLPEHGVRSGTLEVGIWASVTVVLIAMITAGFADPGTAGLQWLLEPLRTIFIVLALASVLQLGKAFYRTVRDSSTTLRKAKYGYTAAVFRPDGAALVCTGLQSSIWHTNISPTKEWQEATATSTQRLGFAAAFSQNGWLLAGAGLYGIQLWDGQTWNKLTELTTDGVGADAALAVSPDGMWLATNDWSDGIAIWDTAKESVMRVVGHDLFSSLAVSPDGAVLAGMDWTGTTTLWATSDWQQLRTLGSPDPTPGSVAFSPDGTMFASAHLRSVSVWHTKTWAETRLVRARYWRPPIAIAFSPDSAYFAYGIGTHITLMDTATWSWKWTLLGHQQPVTSLAFSPNGGILASTSLDRTIKLWAVDAGSLESRRSQPVRGWSRR